ncbi:helix-turn-helix domain-containing protein [Streptomyces sedi]|uniref:Helix-turn-helix domain-containing protein n=1 Tax=Streptomyces sedi TaxID=555059 RepID=A0A5C4VAS2_9ACTN|nr:helix-turn-helix domain-containing protein [Streptomyces sedi]TNM32675.1 helix-turn-helix domain-containing protein [Streptomyces sedi]
MNGQRLFAELLVRPELRAELRADPGAFARAHGLDPALCGRIAGLPEPGMELTTGITQYERRLRVTTVFPATFALADSAQREALLRSALTHPRLSRGGDAAAVEVGRLLAKAAAEWAPEAGGGVSLLAEMVEFETLCEEALASARALPGRVPGPPAPAPGVLFVTSGRPLPVIRRLLLGGTPPAELAAAVAAESADEGPWHYALRAEARPPRTRCHRLPARLARLLTYCDGTRGLPELATLTELPEPTAERTLRTMVGRGLITWRAAGPE